MRITILGGTGYTGRHLASVAVARGHVVTSFSRTLSEPKIDGVKYETGSLLDEGTKQKAVADADIVISALSPRAGLENDITAVNARVGEIASEAGVRFGVIGGFSSLRPAAGVPRFAESGDMPPQFAEEGRTMFGVLNTLMTSAPEELDWFYVSPAAMYGAFAPGEATGSYRVGGDTALFNSEGESAISGADFALAVIEEAELPKHHRIQFSVAY